MQGTEWESDQFYIPVIFKHKMYMTKRSQRKSRKHIIFRRPGKKESLKRTSESQRFWLERRSRCTQNVEAEGREGWRKLYRACADKNLMKACHSMTEDTSIGQTSCNPSLNFHLDLSIVLEVLGPTGHNCAELY